jgi:hypothetical protein
MNAYKFDPATPRNNPDTSHDGWTTIDTSHDGWTTIDTSHDGWTTIDTFQHAGFTLELAYAHDDDFSAEEWAYPEDADGFDPMVMRVQARVRGLVLGSAYLGGCMYDNPTDFIAGGYFEGMVNEALEAAKHHATALVTELAAL